MGLRGHRQAKGGPRVLTVTGTLVALVVFYLIVQDPGPTDAGRPVRRHNEKAPAGARGGGGGRGQHAVEVKRELEEEAARPSPPPLPVVPGIRMNTGASIPAVAFGTWRLKNNAGSIEAALKLGYRHIDTAVAYQNEHVIGATWRRLGIKREDLFLTTKLLPQDFGKATTMASFAESLAKLKTDYVDLYLLHAPGPKWEESWKVLEELHKSGKARAIGISNFDVPLLRQLDSLASVKPAVLQNYMNPARHDGGSVQYCRENGIVYQSFSTLGSDRSNGQLLTDPMYGEMSQKYHKSRAQVVLKWALQQGLVVLPRSDSPQHMRENIELFDFTLTEAEMKRISDLAPNT